MSAFDDLKKKPSDKRSRIEWCILIVSQGMVADTAEPELAEAASKELKALQSQLARQSAVIEAARKVAARLVDIYDNTEDATDELFAYQDLIANDYIELVKTAALAAEGSE